MASTYSSNLKIELMGTGENSGTWGSVTNTNLGTTLEQAVIGLGNPDYTSDANLTITITDSNASQAARCLVLNVTSTFGSLTATRELIVPTSQKQYIVQNNTTGGQSITVKTSAGTGITVPNGRKAHLYVNGTNVIQMFDFINVLGGTIDGATVGATTASTGAFTSLTASGATTLNGAVALGDAAGDLITVPGTVNSNLLFTDATYDIGATGATRPRDLFLSRNLTVGGTLTLAGGVNLNGNVTVGDSSADTLTINSTITSNLIFTDNTYDIGASGATRPRSLFLAGNITAAGNQTLTGALTVDSTTDSTSTTTGSIQTDGGLGVAKALFVGTTANIAGVATFSAGSAAAPAITTTGDTNTGMWFPAADTIAFTEGGVESMRIDASGNLGLGVTPSAWLSTWKALQVSNRTSLSEVAGITFFGNNFFQNTSSQNIYLQNGFATLYGQNAGSHNWQTAPSGTAGGVVTFTQAMTLDASGQLGIGTTSPNARLEAGSTSDVGFALSNSSSVTSGNRGNIYMLNSSLSTVGLIRFGAVTDNVGTEIQFHTRPAAGSLTQTMTLNSAGNLGAGTNNPVVRLQSNISTTGVPATTGTTQTNGALRLSSSATSGIIDFGLNGSSPWIQATDYTDLSQTYNLSLNPNGGNVNIGIGNLLVGTTSLRTTGYTTGVSQYAMETTGYGGAQWFVNRTDDEGTYIVLGKSRGTTANSNTVVANADTLGAVIWEGTTGSGVAAAAQVRAKVDGSTINASSMPGRLEFYTTASGSTSPTERVRIDNAGTFILKNDYQEQTFTANSSTAITLNIVTNGTDQVITLTGTATITMPTATAGKSFLLKLKTGAGAYTVTWSTVKWPSGTAPTLTSTASRMDIFSFFSDGTNWYGTTVGQNYTP